MSTNPGVWLGAIATISVYSYLFGENRLFRFMEYLLVGLSAAHLTVVGIRSILDTAVRPMLDGSRLTMIIAVVLGLLLLSRWTKRWAWLSRLPISFMMIVAAALTLTGTMDASFVRQVKATMVPIKDIDTFLMFVGVVGTCMYFLFIEPPGKQAGVTTLFSGFIRCGRQVGKCAMMVAFGGAFGATVMSRIGLFIGRLQYLLGEWIYLIR